MKSLHLRSGELSKPSAQPAFFFPDIGVPRAQVLPSGPRATSNPNLRSTRRWFGGCLTACHLPPLPSQRPKPFNPTFGKERRDSMGRNRQ